VSVDKSSNNKSGKSAPYGRPAVPFISAGSSPTTTGELAANDISKTYNISLVETIKTSIQQNFTLITYMRQKKIL
jgi:hypothetical protein